MIVWVKVLAGSDVHATAKIWVILNLFLYQFSFDYSSLGTFLFLQIILVDADCLTLANLCTWLRSFLDWILGSLGEIPAQQRRRLVVPRRLFHNSFFGSFLTSSNLLGGFRRGGWLLDLYCLLLERLHWALSRLAWEYGDWCLCKSWGLWRNDRWLAQIWFDTLSDLTSGWVHIVVNNFAN